MSKTCHDSLCFHFFFENILETVLKQGQFAEFIPPESIFQISLLKNILEPVLKQDQFVEFIPPELGYLISNHKSHFSNPLNST